MTDDLKGSTVSFSTFDPLQEYFKDRGWTDADYEDYLMSISTATPAISSAIEYESERFLIDPKFCERTMAGRVAAVPFRIEI